MRSRTASIDNPLAFLVIGLAAVIAAFAEEPTNKDIAFITTATQGGMAEIELSKLAIDSGNSPQVRIPTPSNKNSRDPPLPTPPSPPTSFPNHLLTRRSVEGGMTRVSAAFPLPPR